jgi:cytochrome P450
MVQPSATSPAKLPVLEPLQFFQDPIGYLQSLAEAHGNIVAINNGYKPMVIAFGPEYNQPIFSRPEQFYSNLFVLPGPKGSAARRLGMGLISMNSEQHKRHRRLLMPVFHKRMVETYRDSLVDTVETVLARWQTGQVRDLAREASQLALQSNSKILFGFDDPEAAYRIGSMMEEILERNTKLGISGLLPVEGASQAYQELVAVTERLEKALLVLIERKRAAGCEANDVLSILIRTHDEDGSRMTNDDLVGQACILFGAANRTTASALTWTLFLLAQHPMILADVVDELDSVLHGEPPTAAQLNQLELLDRVLKESLRILPPVAFGTRTANEAVELGPYRLAKGTTVLFSQYITHHMPELFAEPERFWPDRWLTISPSPYAYIPYGAGPRLCIGAPLATATLKIALAMMLQRFRLTVVPNTRIDRKVAVTLVPAQGMPMRIHPPDRKFARSPVQGNIHAMVTLIESEVYRLTVPAQSRVLAKPPTSAARPVLERHADFAEALADCVG